ncbi:hypothetical protein [Romboutsia sp.]|uniref:hypothetical protein n=1 Tax=Romboutsia sp. TaxID=1965302 RepID=UPI003F35314D
MKTSKYNQYTNAYIGDTSGYHSLGCGCNGCISCNCGCNPKPKPTPNPIPKPIKDCCCTNSIRKALLAIQSTVAEMNIPGFSINITLTTTTGLMYPIFMSASTAEPVIIGEDIITYGKTAISLCNIAKIDIQSSQVAGTGFDAALLSSLVSITTYCSELAMAIDDDDLKYRYPMRGNKNPCSSCYNNSKCDTTDCCCTPGIQEYLNENKANIDSISYEGSLQHVQSVSAVTTIVSTTVVAGIITVATTIPVLNNVTPNVVNTTVVNSVATIPTKVVTSVATIPADLLANVTNTTATAAAPITVTSTTVVNSVATIPADLLADVTNTTATAAAPITVTPTTVVNSVATIPADLLANVTGTTASAAAPIIVTPTTVVTSVGRNTPSAGIVTGIGSASNSFVNSITAVSVPIKSDYTNPTVVDGVISGLSAATIVATQQLQGFIITGVGVVAGGLFAGGVTIVDRNNNPISIVPFTIHTLGAAANLLDVTGAPVITNHVLTGLGTPTTTTVVTSLTLSTANAVTGVLPSTIPDNYLNTVTSSSINVVSGTPTSVTVVDSIATIPQTVNTVGVVTSSSINVVSGTPTSVTVVDSITTIPQTVNTIGVVTSSSINVVSGTPTSVTVVDSITTIPQTVNTVGIVTSTTIAQISNIISGKAVQSVTLTNTSVSAVNGVTVTPQFTTAMQSASTSTISVFAPVVEPITGTIVTLGGGIMVVSLPNGDISILSLCEVQSVETK